MQKIGNIQELCETVKKVTTISQDIFVNISEHSHSSLQRFHNFKLQFDNFLIIVQNKQYLRLIVGDHRS